MSAASIISELQLQPHPEGGWYREVYRSPTRIETSRGPRSALTTIYYLLEQSQLGRWHVVQADELWHYYGGAELELFSFHPATRKLVRTITSGNDPEAFDLSPDGKRIYVSNEDAAEMTAIDIASGSIPTAITPCTPGRYKNGRSAS